MSVPEIVHRLVDLFHCNLNACKSGDFDEAQIRVDFINPLFGDALGWDIHNEKDYSEAYRDVVYEDRVKIGGRTKAPDHGFYIGRERAAAPKKYLGREVYARAERRAEPRKTRPVVLRLSEG